MDDDWLPIETAPVNERILVATPLRPGEWDFRVDEVDEDGEWEITDGDATYWTRLPAPPSTFR